MAVPTTLLLKKGRAGRKIELIWYEVLVMKA